MTSHDALVDGVPIRWEEHGNGTPVVLVHGIPTSPDLWRHVVPRLDGLRVLSFEMVGYGGGVVQIAAVHRPQRCAGLMLTNAIAYDSWPIPSVKALRATRSVFVRAPDPMLKAVMGTLIARGHDDATTARESFDIHHRHYTDHDGAAALARQVAALDVRDTLAVADQLSRLDVPARIVWGLDDQFQKAIYGQRLAVDLGTRPIGIRGGKQFTPEDHPDIVATAIRDLVD